MIAVITGDIINSRKVGTEEWLPKLEAFLKSTIKKKKSWNIYRGDSFQIEIDDVANALEIVLCIKALIKTNNKIDVRMAIGIGEVDFKGKNVTESNGTAYINSGESFDNIKHNTLVVKSPFQELDEYFNPILKLLSFISNNWKSVTAETIYWALTNKELQQKELAEQIKKDKAAVNRALKRAGYDEIKDVLNLYSSKIKQWLN